MRRLALLLLAAFPGEAHEVPVEPRGGVTMTIRDPATYWTRSGFVEMTPPVRLPSRDGNERIAVWIRIPPGGRLRVEPRAANRPTLRLPPGTIVDRVDLAEARDPGSVQDVRGTRFEEDGQEYFHVLRPFASTALSGFEWTRSDPLAAQIVTSAMRTRLAATLDSDEYGSPARALALFERQNDCATCHAHDHPEQRGAGRDPSLPNRATDGNGLYTLATVLSDSAPLEMHRARDMNEDDPFVTVSCADGGAASFFVRGARRHFACPDGSVPRATLDMKRALAQGDSRARDVCRSRAYLGRHMDAEGRSAFAEAFAECGE
jgi:hypothetical protein